MGEEAEGAETSLSALYFCKTPPPNSTFLDFPRKNGHRKCPDGVD
jgi:hypothetical protein